MITPSGYNTDLFETIQLVLLTTSLSVVFVDGEYYLANEFSPASGHVECTTLTGICITSQLELFSSTQVLDNSKMPITDEYIRQQLPVIHQFHKNQNYRWFKNIKKVNKI